MILRYAFEMICKGTKKKLYFKIFLAFSKKNRIFAKKLGVLKG